MAKYFAAIVCAMISIVANANVPASVNDSVINDTVQFINHKSVAENAPTDTTSTGVKYYNSRDYQFEAPHKVHHELNISAIATNSGKSWAAGLNLEARRVYTPTQNFGWFIGGNVSLVQSLKDEELADSYSFAEILPEIGIQLGNESFSVEVAALAGMGQSLCANKSTSPDGLQYHENFTNKWGFSYGAKAGLNVQLSERVSLGLWARYTTSTAGGDNYEQPEGWSKEPAKTHFGDKISFGVNVGIRLGQLSKMRHVSGDNCWHVSPYAVYSITDNEGFGAGMELFHTKRLNYHWMRAAGFGAEQTFGQTKANRVFAKFGFEWLPKGSSSPFILNGGIKTGVGQFNQTASGATSDKSFVTNDNVMSLGVYGNLYAGMKIHVGRVCFNAGVEGGVRTTFGSGFTALNQSDYAGTTGKTFGFNARATAGISIAF